MFRKFRWFVLVAVAACGSDDVGPGQAPQLLFITRESQTVVALYRAAQDGSSPRLVRRAYGLVSPRWSPDGTTIAYLSIATSNADLAELRIINADGTGDRSVLGPGNYYYGLDWSPDGKRLVLAEQQAADGSLRIATVTLDGGNLSYLTSGAFDWWPRWSPSGDIAFSRSCRECEPALQGITDLWVMRADGSEQLQLTHGATISDDSFAGDWSPDGQWIVYTTGEIKSAVRRVRFDGSAPGTLVPPPDRGDGSRDPVFNPDGGRVLFTSAGHLQTADPDGGRVTGLSTGFDTVWSPDWSH